MSKILLFDIGNTSIKVGLANSQGVENSYTLRTDAGQTADSLGITLFTLLAHAKCDSTSIEACVCSSVVPSMTPLVREACTRFVGAKFYQVPQDIEIPLKNCYSKPQEVGADRLVCAFAARRLVPESPSLIVVDFGTATTFDCISEQSYLGGLIFPGVHTAALALTSNTAKLPRVNLEFEDMEPIVGRDTVSSIQHGIVFGFCALVEGITARLSKQLPTQAKILGTGGFAKDIAKRTNCFYKVIPDLILDGLRKLYYNKD